MDTAPRRDPILEHVYSTAIDADPERVVTPAVTLGISLIAQMINREVGMADYLTETADLQDLRLAAVVLAYTAGLQLIGRHGVDGAREVVQRHLAALAVEQS